MNMTFSTTTASRKSATGHSTAPLIRNAVDKKDRLRSFRKGGLRGEYYGYYTICYGTYKTAKIFGRAQGTNSASAGVSLPQERTGTVLAINPWKAYSLASFCLSIACILPVLCA